MKVEWDARKAKLNFEKHGVAFEEAGTALSVCAKITSQIEPTSVRPEVSKPVLSLSKGAGAAVHASIPQHERICPQKCEIILARILSDPMAVTGADPDHSDYVPGGAAPPDDPWDRKDSEGNLLSPMSIVLIQEGVLSPDDAWISLKTQ